MMFQPPCSCWRMRYMSQIKRRTLSRKASAAQTDAMAHAVSHLETDVQATAALGAGAGDESMVYASLPDEEIDFASKVDFSVLRSPLMEVNILDEGSARLLPEEQLYEYVSHLEETVRFYVGQYQAVAKQLANAMELILNQRNELFGSTSQRSSSLFGKKTGRTAPSAARADRKSSRPAPDDHDEQKPEISPDNNVPDPCNAGQSGKDTDNSPKGMENKDAADLKDGSTERLKGQPKRSAGCAAKIYEDARVQHIDCTLSQSELDKRFGEGGWKEMPSGERLATEYSIIPATVIVKIFHLHAYCAKDCIINGGPDLVRAKSPVERARQKSPISSGLLASLLYNRNALRIPVSRICDDLGSMGLKITPQRIYENLRYYNGFFTILLEHLWTILLNSRYIQIDETPVLYYDSKTHQMKRGYLWVFTTSEMLATERPLTLFYFAQGRGADVLRECLRGYKGVIGSDGHGAYHVFARESDGDVINAGCLDHFRKRVVAALRAVPNLKEMSEEERLTIPAYVIMLKLNRVFQLERKTKMLDTKEERDAYRKGIVKDAFDELVKTTLATDLENCPAESYTSRAVKYMQNQKVYLQKFLEDSNIASNNSKCERKFAFFATLRNQIKMFGSVKGAEAAATFESIEQTAREYIPNTRIYYKYLIDKMCPFIREKRKEDPNVDFSTMDEIGQFQVWSPEYMKYEESVRKKEEILTTVIDNF